MMHFRILHLINEIITSSTKSIYNLAESFS